VRYRYCSCGLGFKRGSDLDRHIFEKAAVAQRLDPLERADIEHRPDEASSGEPKEAR
jgi:hypothetical protein